MLDFVLLHEQLVAVSQGVEFDQINVNIPDEYKQMYDTAAAVWLQVKEAIDSCKDRGLIESKQAKVRICAYHCHCQLAFSKWHRMDFTTQLPTCSTAVS